MVHQISKFAGIRAVRNPAKVALAIVTIATLVGCSSYEKLPQQNANRDYQVYMVTTGNGGDLTLFLIKAFEVDGKVAMCGGFTSGSSALAKNIDRNFADISQVYLDGTKLGNSDFLIRMPIHFRQGDDPEEGWTRLASEEPATNCVKTNVDWRPEFANAEIERKGPSTVRGFD